MSAYTQPDTGLEIRPTTGEIEMGHAHSSDDGALDGARPTTRRDQRARQAETVAANENNARRSMISAFRETELPLVRTTGVGTRRIMGGIVKKCGRRFAGVSSRWVALWSNMQLTSSRSERLESTPTKIYALSGSIVRWGMLGSGEFAIRLKLQGSQTRQTLTLIVESERHMNRWVGALRCMFAGSDAILCRPEEVGGRTCAICLCDFVENQELHVLPCEHRFCPECISCWLENSSLCPMCKGDCTAHGVPLIRNGRFSHQGHQSSMASPGAVKV